MSTLFQIEFDAAIKANFFLIESFDARSCSTFLAFLICIMMKAYFASLFKTHLTNNY